MLPFLANVMSVDELRIRPLLLRRVQLVFVTVSRVTAATLPKAEFPCLMCHARDLKPENFLLSSKAEDAPLKGCDFGLSVFYRPGEVFQDIVGSAYYVAPEVRTLCLSRAQQPDIGFVFCTMRFDNSTEFET